MNSKRVFFDVVNSVKGGSGKSTFSLLLAAFYNHRNREGKPLGERYAQAYIIDLDLCGTSWEMNYGQYMQTNYWKENDSTYLQSRRGEEHAQYPFINNMLWNYDKYRNKSFWSYISFTADETSQENGQAQSTYHKVMLCPAKTDQRSTVDQIEVDMFEHTIKRIILDVLETHRSDSEVDDVHIIFDMPPSYEKHAEAILKHLLASLNSELLQAVLNKTGLFNKNNNGYYYEPYEINLFMLNAISRAHVEQNSMYLHNWFQNMEYSSAVTDLMQKNHFKICYILNDICDIMRESNQSFEEICRGLEDSDDDGYFAHLKKTRDFVANKGRGVFNIKWLEHLDLLEETEIFFNKTSEKRLMIQNEVFATIESATKLT